MSGVIFNVRTRVYQAPTETLTGLPCRRLFIPNNPTLVAAVNDVIAYLAQPNAWEGEFIDVVKVTAAISACIVNQEICEDEDMPIGAVIAIATATVPSGYLLCDGTQYNRVDYPTLFSLLSANYQLDGDTFVTPDLRGIFIMGGGHDDFDLDSTGGSYSETLDTSKMPYHQHTFSPHNHGYSGVTIDSVDVAIGGGLASLVTPDAQTTDDSGFMTDGGQGGSAPHNNTPPYRVLAYAIRAE